MKTEGRNAVLELLKTDKTIEKILMEKQAKGSLSLIFAEARKKGIRVQFAERAVLDGESESGRHQGVIAFCSDYEYASLEDIMAEKKRADGFVILCDGIEDVHNLGSILRVAECAGADGVVIPKAKGAPVNEGVIRVSAGAAAHVKVARVGSLTQAIQTLKQNGYWIYALEADGESLYREDFKGGVALVIGGEDSGVRRIVKENSDKTLSIPMFGKVNSLNASVALGVAVYEVVRRKGLS